MGSSQLAVRGGEVAEAYSFDIGLLAPESLGVRAARGALSASQLLEGFPAVEAQLAETVAASLPSSLAGDFVLMEWLGTFICSQPSERDRNLGLGWEQLLTVSGLLE